MSIFSRGPEKDDQLYAPISGEVINIETVSDPVFAKKMLGEGFGVTHDGSNATIVSPVAGEVTVAQGHAVGIKRYDGLEVLIHIGIDTVSLNGAPFTLNTKLGKKVKGGDELVTVDWQQIKDAGLDDSVLVLITNSKTNMDAFDVDYKQANAGDVIGKVTAK